MNDPSLSFLGFQNTDIGNHSSNHKMSNDSFNAQTPIRNIQNNNSTAIYPIPHF